jgi:hemolysin activation/secretion protein
MRFGTFIVCCGAWPATLALAPFAQAQTAVPVLPYNAGAASRQAEETQQQVPVPQPAAVPVLPHLADPLFTIKDKETLFVRSFELDGPGLVAEAEVREILAPYENRKLTLTEIYEAADKITLLYCTHGPLFAKAYVPAQDARHGTLRIKLLPGQYGTITLNNASLIRDDFLRGVIDHAIGEGEPVIQKDQLERVMMLMSDMPGGGMPRVTNGPGQRPGTSDFLFEVPEARRIDGYLMGDNFGPGFTGRDRLVGSVNLNSPLGYGDKLSAFGLVSNQTHLEDADVKYGFPLGYSGLRGQIDADRSTYVLGGTFASLHATGITEGVTATLSYPIVRREADSLFIAGSFTHRRVDDKIGGIAFADRTVDSGTAVITRETNGVLPFTGLPLITSTTFSFTEGYVNYADPAQKAFNLAGPASAGNYARINLSFNGTVFLTERWSVSTFLRAQKALTGNLDTSEQFYVSGFSGVRSFDEGFAGDSGIVVTPELKYVLPEFYGYHHAIGLFTDVGAAWLENGSYTVTQNSYTPLNDVGLSYRANYEYLPARFITLNAQVAHSYGTDDSAALVKSYDRHTKGLVQVGFTF